MVFKTFPYCTNCSSQWRSNWLLLVRLIKPKGCYSCPSLLHNTTRAFWDIWLFLFYSSCWFFEIFSLVPLGTAWGGPAAALQGLLTWLSAFLTSPVRMPYVTWLSIDLDLPETMSLLHSGSSISSLATWNYSHKKGWVFLKMFCVTPFSYSYPTTRQNVCFFK